MSSTDTKTFIGHVGLITTSKPDVSDKLTREIMSIVKNLFCEGMTQLDSFAIVSKPSCEAADARVRVSPTCVVPFQLLVC